MMVFHRFGILCLLLLTLPSTAKESFERTEVREPCRDHQLTRQALFGDLHVHTSYSFDSYLSSQRRDPWDAYRYAKGGAIILPDANGDQTIEARIGRPLDFTAVTDHAEFFGQINVCTLDDSQLGYWWPHCMMTRASNIWLQLLAANWWTDLGGQLEDPPSKSFACSVSDCDKGDRETCSRPNRPRRITMIAVKNVTSPPLSPTNTPKHLTKTICTVTSSSEIPRCPQCPFQFTTPVTKVSPVCGGN